MTELRSWYAEKYPMHECTICSLQHVRIPTITILEEDPQGGQVQSKLVPFELVGMAEGVIRPGAGLGIDTPARIVGLFWGVPGAQQPTTNTVLCLN